MQIAAKKRATFILMIGLMTCSKKCVTKINIICRLSQNYLILHHKYGQLVASYIYKWLTFYYVCTGCLDTILLQMFSWQSGEIKHVERIWNVYIL